MDNKIRNLNPHKPAVAATWIWNERYMASGTGAMEFWDSLSESEQVIARKCIDEIYFALPE